MLEPGRRARGGVVVEERGVERLIVLGQHDAPCDPLPLLELVREYLDASLSRVSGVESLGELALGFFGAGLARVWFGTRCAASVGAWYGESAAGRARAFYSSSDSS